MHRCLPESSEMISCRWFACRVDLFIYSGSCMSYVFHCIYNHVEANDKNQQKELEARDSGWEIRLGFKRLQQDNSGTPPYSN